MDDRERLERYLQWRCAHDRSRAARRRRWLGYGALVASLGLTGTTLLLWLTEESRPAISRTRPPADIASISDAPVRGDAPALVEHPAPARPPRPRAAERPVRRAPRRSVPAIDAPAQPAPATATSPAIEERGETADPAAAVAAPPPPPAVTPPSDPPGGRPDAVEAAPPFDDLPAAEQRAAATEPAPLPTTVDPVTSGATPTARNRVAGWLRGEVQEFRDGVTREVREFRSGFERLGRGARALGSKLRGNE